jgi:enterochelin esterase-like enzyme
MRRAGTKRVIACLALLAAACTRSRSEPVGAAAPPSSDPSAALPRAENSANVAAMASSNSDLVPAEERTWSYATTSVGRMNVVVLVPAHRRDERLPVLLTMHGRGEAMKGPERGARGWVDDYQLPRAIQRLGAPPLTREDFRLFVQKPRLERLNAALAAKPYRGLIIVCPYTPDMLTGDDPFSKAPPLAEFLVDQLVPRVYRETPALGTPATTGIDGVSLGGRAAITVGLLRPEAFGVIAALQAAFHSDHAEEIAERARRARQSNPALRFRLVTSNDDFFLEADTAIARALKASGIPVDFTVVTGPHDYDFNRGPGAIEMLTFHDRVLRGEPPP